MNEAFWIIPIGICGYLLVRLLRRRAASRARVRVAHLLLPYILTTEWMRDADVMKSLQKKGIDLSEREFEKVLFWKKEFNIVETKALPEYLDRSILIARWYRLRHNQDARQIVKANSRST